MDKTDDLMETPETQMVEFEAGGRKVGIYVDPPSDIVWVYIQCPPSLVEVKKNPRPVVILFTADRIALGDVRINAIKMIAEEQKLFIVCPAAFDDDTLLDTVEWLQRNAKEMNIDPTDIRGGYAPDSEAASAAFREMASGEFEEEFRDAGEFAL